MKLINWDAPSMSQRYPQGIQRGLPKDIYIYIYPLPLCFMLYPVLCGEKNPHVFVVLIAKSHENHH